MVCIQNKKSLSNKNFREGRIKKTKNLKINKRASEAQNKKIF